MPLFSTAMADDQLVTLHLKGRMLLCVMVLFILPVVIPVKVGQHTQS
jgi:hypothetical protein